MADTETLKIYAARIDEYQSCKATKVEASALTDFLSMVPAGGKILDLGCGPGVHAAQMLTAGFTVKAMDATPEFVDVARARGVDAQLATFDDLDAIGTYDGIWASFSLLHAAKSDFPRHLAAIHTALKPGGALFLGMKLGTGERRDKIGRFYSYYSEGELRQALATAGFTAIETTCGEGVGLAGNLDPFILMTANA